GEKHLLAACHWLIRSIDVCGGRGSSKAYRFFRGWMPAYPETSGYIIPTLLMLECELGGKDQFAKRALAIGRWLATIQQPSGGYRAGDIGEHGPEDVFDTGMILLGINALIHRSPDQALLIAGRKAADFLVASMGENGCFVHNIHKGMLHTYNVRAAWGLVAFGKLIGN